MFYIEKSKYFYQEVGAMSIADEKTIHIKVYDRPEEVSCFSGG